MKEAQRLTSFNDEWQRVYELVLNHQRFVITSHIHSDGDALGSAIALSRYLKSLNKTVRLLIPGEIPAKYDFLETDSQINRLNSDEAKQYIQSAEVIFILDISAPDRMDIYHESIIRSAAIKIWIDHHPLLCPRDSICIVDTEKIATAELLYDFFKGFGVNISNDMAVCLYTAVLSDSGGFRFKGTSAFTFAMAAELVESGADPALIYHRVFETGYHEQIRAWGEILQGIKQDNFISYAVVPRDLMDKYRIEPDQLDGLIDLMRKDGQSEIFIVFVEKEKDEIMVGLRSRNGYNVGLIAEKFGGGGHFHAAGFTLHSALKKVIDQTLERIIMEHVQKQVAS